MDYSARDLAELAHSESLLEAAVGIAAINALLPRYEERWADLNAEEVMVQYGRGKHVALVLVLGPSTPLSPLLFEHGIHFLSGAVVEDVEVVLRAVS